MRLGNEGFGLLNMMFQIGMMGAISVLWMNQNATELKAANSVEAGREISRYVDQVYSVVSKPSLCQAALVGNLPGQELRILDPHDSNATLAAANYSTDHKWKVSSVALRNVETVSAEDGIKRGRLEIQAEKDKKYSLGATYQRKTVATVYFKTNETGAISECFGSSAPASDSSGDEGMGIQEDRLENAHVSLCEMIPASAMQGLRIGRRCALRKAVMERITAFVEADGEAALDGMNLCQILGLPTTSNGRVERCRWRGLLNETDWRAPANQESQQNTPSNQTVVIGG